MVSRTFGDLSKKQKIGSNITINISLALSLGLGHARMQLEVTLLLRDPSNFRYIRLLHSELY